MLIGDANIVSDSTSARPSANSWRTMKLPSESAMQWPALHGRHLSGTASQSSPALEVAHDAWSASCATGQARLASGRARRKVRRVERLLHRRGQWRAMTMSQRDCQPARLGERVDSSRRQVESKRRHASCRPVRYLIAPEGLRACLIEQ